MSRRRAMFGISLGTRPTGDRRRGTCRRRDAAAETRRTSTLTYHPCRGGRVRLALTQWRATPTRRAGWRAPRCGIDPAERLARVHELCRRAFDGARDREASALMLPDLAGLIGALRGAGVRFVAIGGIAVAAHEYVRATEDLDLVPDPARENLDAFADVLGGLNARLLRNPDRGIDAAVRTALHSGRNLTLTTSKGRPRRGPAPARRAVLRVTRRRRVGSNDPRRVVRVCSRDHLIAMKRARGSALDRADLERLLEASD